MDAHLLVFVLLIVLFAAGLCATWHKTLSLNRKRTLWIMKAFLLYLSIPVALFLLSMPWPKPLRVLVSLGFLAFPAKALAALRGPQGWPGPPACKIRLGPLFLFHGILIASYAGLLAGQGFVHDWPKHRSVLLCLYENPLDPGLTGFDVHPGIGLENRRLVYYYGHYLPSPYLMRIASLFHAPRTPQGVLRGLQFFYFLWLMLGMGFCSLLLPAACEGFWGHRPARPWGPAYGVLIAFSGLNMWCMHWVKPFTFIVSCLGPARTQAFLDRFQFQWHSMFGRFSTFGDGHAEWVTPLYAQISSIISDWQWAPQHLVSALCSVTILGLYRQHINRFPLVIWSTSTLVTSTFGWIGSLPLALGLILDAQRRDARSKPEAKQDGRPWLRRGAIVEGAVGCLLAASILAFYASVGSGIEAKGIWMRFYGHIPTSGLISTNPALMLNDGPLRVGLFYLIEFLPLALIFLAARSKKCEGQWMRGFLLAWLMPLPMILMGGNNDLCMRGSIPAILALLMWCGMMIEEMATERRLRSILWVAAFFLLVLPGFANELVMGWKSHSKTLEKDLVVIRQYAGASMRPPPPRPGSEMRSP